MNVEVSKHKQKRRGRTLLRILLIMLVLFGGFGIWYTLIRDVEPEENVIQQPTLSVPGNTANAGNGNETTTDADDHMSEANDTPTTAGITELTAPSIDVAADNYRLYVFDVTQSNINFTIQATNTKGRFGLFGHWFELIYVPEEDAWRIVLWFDIDGQSVNANGIPDEALILAFQAERYPVGRFIGESTTLVADLSVENSVTITGEVEISGQVQPLEVPMTFSINEDGVMNASAEFTLDVSEFGVSIPGGLSTDFAAVIRVVAIETAPEDYVPVELPNASQNEEISE